MEDNSDIIKQLIRHGGTRPIIDSLVLRNNINHLLVLNLLRLLDDDDAAGNGARAKKRADPSSNRNRRPRSPKNDPRQTDSSRHR